MAEPELALDTLTRRHEPHTFAGPVALARRALGRSPRAHLRALRLGWRAVLAASVSECTPALGPLPLPPLAQRALRAVLLARGLTDDNELGAGIARRAALRLQRRLEGAPAARPEPLPELDRASWDSDDVHARFVRPMRPVILRGFAASARRWSVRRFVEEYGEHRVMLTDTDGANYDGAVRDLDRPAPNGAPLYIHNERSIFGAARSFVDDLPIAELARLVRRHAPITLSFFASTRTGTSTGLHCGGNLNTFLLLEGRKRWTFVDPSYFLLVYPYLSHTNNYHVSLIEDETDQAQFHRWPLFRWCPRYVADLEPGDVLLSPTWWYHGIRNLAPSTLAVAVRWAPYARGEATTNGLFRLLDEFAARQDPAISGSHDETGEAARSAAARAAWGLA